MRHAQLRNVIERIFGVAKKKFTIWKKENEYDVRLQVKLVYGVATLHNMMRRAGNEDNIDEEDERVDDGLEEETQTSSRTESSSPEAKEAAALRDRIARNLWREYQSYIVTL